MKILHGPQFTLTFIGGVLLCAAPSLQALKPSFPIRPPRATTALEIMVTNESGRSVESAEVIIRKQAEEYWNSSWVESEDGVARIRSHDAHSEGPMKGVFDVVVRAPGYAPAFATCILPAEKPLDIVLDRGHEVTLTVHRDDGTPLPDSLRPGIVLPGYRLLIWKDSMLSHLSSAGGLGTRGKATLSFAEPLGQGRFSVRLPDGPETFDVLINEPGFMRGFLAGPFENQPDALHDIALPTPGVLKVSVDVPQEVAEATKLGGYSLEISAKSNMDGGEERWGTSAFLWQQPAEGHVLSDVLVAGDYHVRVSPVQTKRAGQDAPDARFQGGGSVQVSAGQTTDVTVTYELIDPTISQGEGTAILRIQEQDGSPAAGHSYIVTYSDDEVDDVLVADGKVPEDGRLVLEGLRDKEKKETYYLLVDNESLGHFFFKDGNLEVDRTFTLPPQAGDFAPVITLEDIATSNRVDTALFKGQVVYLDFWATWCGPCQGPMAKLDELAGRRGAEWAGRVVLAAVSIDSRREDLRTHLDCKKWTHPLNLWAADGK